MAEPRHVTVLLGAGASHEAGIPTSIGMTTALIDQMQQARETRRHVQLLQFIRHTLAADLVRPDPDDRHYEQSPIQSDVDVERLFAAVDILVDRADQPWSPFVSAWHPTLAAFAPAPGLHPFDLSGPAGRVANEIAKLAPSSSRGHRPTFSNHGFIRELNALIVHAIARSQPGDVSNVLDGLRHEMLTVLAQLVTVEDPARVDYLAPLLELVDDQPDLAVATLNYDRSVEIVANERGIDCDTLIHTWLARGRFGRQTGGLTLLKLHGSIDWTAPGDTRRMRFFIGQEQGQLPQQRISVMQPGQERTREERPAVVFGEGGKLRAEGPFLELLLTWSQELRKAERLLVIGYSFRDPHINELIARWANRERGLIVLLDPKAVTSAGSSPFAHALPGLNVEGAPQRFVQIERSVKDGLRDALGALTADFSGHA